MDVKCTKMKPFDPQAIKQPLASAPTDVTYSDLQTTRIDGLTDIKLPQFLRYSQPLFLQVEQLKHFVPFFPLQKNE